MAKKGIEYAVFGILDVENGTYSGGKYLSPVAAYNGTPAKSDVTDYGDNRSIESDESVTGGTLSIEFNNDADEIYTMLLGHTKDTESGEIAYNADDEPPFVGTGAIGREGGTYVGKFYHKVKFAEPNDENATKQENTVFNHITVEGKIFVPSDGVWKKTKRFETIAAAKAWLNGLVGITTTPANTTETTGQGD